MLVLSNLNFLKNRVKQNCNSTRFLFFCVQYTTFIWFINQILSQFVTHCVTIWKDQYIVFEIYA